MKIRLEGTAEELSRWLDAVEPKPQSGEVELCRFCGKAHPTVASSAGGVWCFKCRWCLTIAYIQGGSRKQAIQFYNKGVRKC